jgi:SAM-dependent methyltransferase
VDRVWTAAVDYVHDLDQGPWPWADGSIERILAKDVFEHVSDPVLFMTECHRLLQLGGPLFLKTPHYLHRDAFTDPTHRRFPTEHTFDYWVPGTALFELHNAAYGGVGFMPGPLTVQDGCILLTLYKASAADWPHIRHGISEGGGVLPGFPRQNLHPTADVPDVLSIPDVP